MRTVVEEIGDRVPFLPGTGSHKLDETLELTGRRPGRWAPTPPWSSPRTTRAPPRRRCTSLVRARWPGSSRTCRSSPTTCPRRTAVDIAPETVKRLFTDFDNFVGSQGDHQGLRALLPRAARLRARAAGLVGHRAALPAAARARRRRLRLAPWPTSRRAPWRGCTSCGRSGDFDGHATCTTACTRWSTCCSSRPTRPRRSGCSPSRGCIAPRHVRPPLITPTDAGLAKIRALLAEGERPAPVSTHRNASERSRQVSTAPDGPALRPSGTGSAANSSTASDGAHLRRRRPGVQHAYAQAARRAPRRRRPGRRGRRGRASRGPGRRMLPTAHARAS